MAGLKRISYTEKDHEDIVNDCIERIKTYYGADYWNDFEEDNAGVMLVEAFAYITDLLLFYLDKQANETFLPTATERQNLINMCKLVGYTPKTSNPAQVDVTISVNEVQPFNVTLYAGTALETDEGIIFETSEDAVVLAGENSTHVKAIEGETFEEIIGVSDGEAFQNFYLPRSGIIKVLSIVIADHVWDCVDSLADQSDYSEVFTVEIDAWRRAEIFFGNGKTGKIPPKDENIIAKYRIGGGIQGNVAPGTINNVRNVATDSQGNKIQISVTNDDWASGGTEPESIESIKLNAPRYFETQNRCVTQQDFETFAMNFNGISKAKAIVRERSGEANIIKIYVLSYGNISGSLAIAEQTLKNNLLDYLNKYKMLTDWLEISDGKWSYVDFSGNVIISDGFTSDKILNDIQTSIKSLLNIETREMGEPLRISDVYAAIDNIEGVLSVELDSPVQTITPEINEMLIAGNFQFTFSMKGSGLFGQNI